MKPALPEHICCVRSNLVNETGLTGTYLLRTQTICAGKIFRGTFTLRTQTICAGNFFSGTFTLRTENTSRTACYLMLTHTFLHSFRRKQAFLPKKFRKDLRLLRNPKNFSFLPNFLRKNTKILRKQDSGGRSGQLSADLPTCLN